MKTSVETSDQSNDLLNEFGHATDQGIILIAEALMLGTEEQLPDRLTQHAEACPQCALEALAYFMFVNDTEYKQQILPHPFFKGC